MRRPVPVSVAAILSVVLPVLLIFLSGCFGGDGQKPPAAAAGKHSAKTAAASLLEPCRLITRQDAERLLGEPVREAEMSEKPEVGMKLCMYNPVNADSLGFLQVVITQPAFMPASGVSPADIFHSIREAMIADRTDLDGLGDEAFIATGGLYVLAGEYYLSIGAGNTSRPEIRQRLVDVGRLALERLPAGQ
ncbi:MAG: hypothetical protein JW781_08000 [Deltaproteobacteria bacterium]|nr:hypothetical protein [Candidatus Anaeroferrophillacea bacterium]